MRRSWPLFLLFIAGCDGPKFWKDKFVKEVELHYQTQQIKNAEIAARELEIENLKSYVKILEERIGVLDGRIAQLEGRPRPAVGTLEAKVTAVANEIDLVVLSVGSEQGVSEGMEFWITREGETVGTARVDRVDRKWSAAKLREKKSDPKVGDAATNRPPR